MTSKRTKKQQAKVDSIKQKSAPSLTSKTTKSKEKIEPDRRHRKCGMCAYVLRTDHF